MNILYDFLKGIFIGIANVIPGFSGGTMAVILKVYERLVNGLSKLFDSPIKALKEIWAILLGLIVGVIISVVSITKLLINFPIPTVLFFVGLIIGSIPSLYNNYKNNGKFNKIDIIYFIMAASIIVGLPLINTSALTIKSVDFGLILIMFLLGSICAAAMILPGVSGSLVLMAFGYYLYVTQQASYFLEKIINFDFTGILDTILILVSFLIGAIIGIVFISKLLKKLFDKYPRIIYVIILGLLVASPFAIIYTVVEQYNNQIIEASPWSYIVGILFMFIGAFLALLPDFLEKKKINE